MQSPKEFFKSLAELKEEDKDAAFLGYIKELAADPGFRRRKEEALKQGCPDPANLYGYVADILDDEATRIVMDHISFCSKCGLKVLKLRTELQDPEQDLEDDA